MVETGTSSYYTALGEATEEPVLREICRLIAADEFRHYKLFYDHMRRYLSRERIGMLRRLRIAAGRVGESEDDELAYAWHCGNEAADLPYQHDRCSASYMARAMAFYRFRHIERGMGMIFKAVGLSPRGRLSDAVRQGRLAPAAMAPAPAGRAPGGLRPAGRTGRQSRSAHPRWPRPAGGMAGLSRRIVAFRIMR